MTSPDSVEAEYDELLFAVRRAARYHRRRERGLDRAHDLGLVATVLAGSATITVLLAELPPRWTWVRLIAATLTALASGAELVLGLASGARRHHSAALSLLALERDVLRARTTPTAGVLAELESRWLATEASESTEPLQRAIGTRFRRLSQRDFDLRSRQIRNKPSDSLRVG